MSSDNCFLGDATCSNEPSFMDLFAVHLSGRLLGRECLLHHLNANSLDDPSSVCETFRLYWRTPLWMDDSNKRHALHASSSSLTSLGTTDEWTIVFVDSTFQFDRCKREASTTIGTMLRGHGNHDTAPNGLDEDCFAYVESMPITFAQLANHCESIGIDIECTAPDALAHTMGCALMGMTAKNASAGVKLGKATSAQDVGNETTAETVATIPITLYYEDLQEMGSLETKSSQMLLLNSSASNAWLSCLVREDELATMMTAAKSNDSKEMVSSKENASVARHDAQAAGNLARSFQTWFNAPKRGAPATTESIAAQETALDSCLSGSTSKEGETVLLKSVVASGSNSHHGPADVEISTEETRKTGSNTTTATSTSSTLPSIATMVPSKKTEEQDMEREPRKHQPVKRPPAGYARMSNAKRKRRGKLTFAKPST